LRVSSERRAPTSRLARFSCVTTAPLPRRDSESSRNLDEWCPMRVSAIHGPDTSSALPVFGVFGVEKGPWTSEAAFARFAGLARSPTGRGPGPTTLAPRTSSVRACHEKWTGYEPPWPARSSSTSSSRDPAPRRWYTRYTCPSTVRTDVTSRSAISLLNELCTAPGRTETVPASPFAGCLQHQHVGSPDRGRVDHRLARGSCHRPQPTLWLGVQIRCARSKWRTLQGSCRWYLDAESVAETGVHYNPIGCADFRP